MQGAWIPSLVGNSDPTCHAAQPKKKKLCVNYMCLKYFSITTPLYFSYCHIPHPHLVSSPTVLSVSQRFSDLCKLQVLSVSHCLCSGSKEVTPKPHRITQPLTTQGTASADQSHLPRTVQRQEQV